MPTKKSAAAAVEDTQPSTALAVAQVDALAEYDLDFAGADGLSEVDRDDIKISAKVLNMKGVDGSGKKIPEDQFYDTVDETSQAEIDAVLLELHKTNLYSFFDNQANKTHVVCRSFDRVMGTMEDGTDRPCKGCPDAQWRMGDDGKRTVNCSPVYNIFGFDLAAARPFVMRFRRTSLDIIKTHLQKHHLGRRPLGGGKVGNYPLYTFRCLISARWSDDGKYCLPILTSGERVDRETMVAMMETSRTLRENVMPILTRVPDSSGSDAENPNNTSFDTAAMDRQNAAAAAGGGRKFVDE